MKLMRDLLVTLCMLGMVASTGATDPLSTTVEFKGPWSFIFIKNNNAYCGGKTLNDCIVAISPSGGHKPAVFIQPPGNPTKPCLDTPPLNTGVYLLNLQNPQPDSRGGGAKATFVDDDIVVKSKFYTKLIDPSTNQDRYVVILPNAPDSIEQPSGDAYSEPAKVTEDFVLPDNLSSAQEISYAKGVKIHYKVSALSVSLLNLGTGSSLSQTAPVALCVEPLNPDYYCDKHARQAFIAMNHLLHADPRQYVDFPPYSKACRLVDPQRHDDPLPSVDAFFHVNSKNIDVPSVQELTRTLEELNEKLNLHYKGASKAGIKLLLDHTNAYLQEYQQYDRTNTKEHNEKGMKLAKDLGEAMTIIDKATCAEQKDERDLAWGLGILAVVVQTSTDTGANCKAPMMSGTVQ